MTDWSQAKRALGKSVSLVPTMGFFHDGHLSLIRVAGELSDLVVVSVFVNPIQFGPAEDLALYPRSLERDMELAERCGAEVFFAPAVAEMYPEPPLTRVTVPSLADRLCGHSRPGHFDGVCTVVAKLFNIIQPTRAIFGSKDFQQLAVIRRMVSDLNWGVEVVAHPIVRENDGLAMSSRNSYLSVAERARATCLYQAILKAKVLVAAGETEVGCILAEVENVIRLQSDVFIDYTEIVNAETLEPQQQVGDDSLLALAARVGRTRLIDNAMLMENSG